MKRIDPELRLLLDFWRKIAVEAFQTEQYEAYTHACETLRKLVRPTLAKVKPKGHPQWTLRTLSDREVRQIRKAWAQGMSLIEIERRFAVRNSRVHDIVHRKTYKDVKDVA